MKIIYTGWFISPKELQKASLEKIIEYPHLTLAFKPKDAFLNKFGTVATIKIIGYGNDGDNEGYLCEITPEDEFLKNQIKDIKVPHITLSVSADGKPVNTSGLDFYPIDKPFIIKGVYGAFVSGKVIVKNRG